MIRYALKCSDGHSFDSWFQSAGAFDALKAAGHVTCVICGSSSVEKAIMAPRVAPKGNAKPARAEPEPEPIEQSAPTAGTAIAPQPSTPGPLSGPPSAAEQAFARLRDKVERETEDVGTKFADEARAIHHGEAPERAIRGEAQLDEARALHDEGINVVPLPFLNRRSN